MAKINPDYLTKDEIAWEVERRGEVPLQLVVDLRKQLRKILNSDKADYIKTSVNVDQEFTICQEKILELTALWEELEEGNGRAAIRLTQRTQHLERRVGALVDDPESTPKKDEILSLVTSVQGLLGNLKRLGELSAVECGPRPGSSLSKDTSTAETVTDNPEGKVKLLEQPPRLVVDLVKQFESQSGVSQGNLNENQVSAASMSSGHLPISLEKTSNIQSIDHQGIPVVVPPAVPNSSSVMQASYLNISAYNKLPNPISNMVQQLPSTNGLDVNVLLRFLGLLIRIRDFPGVDDQSLMQLAYPSCREPLLTRLLDCMHQRRKFDDFHEIVLNSFIPMRLKEQLKQQMFYRLQNENESLAGFVSSVRHARELLRLGLSEQDTVEVIIGAMTPAERSRLVFSDKPRSFADLDRLSVASHSIEFTDRQRLLVPKHNPKEIPVLAINENEKSQTNTYRPSPTCFGCGRRGHIRRFCHLERSSGSPSNHSKNGIRGEE